MSRRRGGRDSVPKSTLRVVCDHGDRAIEVARYKVPKDAEHRRRRLSEGTREGVVGGVEIGADWYGEPRLVSNNELATDEDPFGEGYRPPGAGMMHYKVRWRCDKCLTDVTLKPETADRIADDFASRGLSIIPLRGVSATVSGSNSGTQHQPPV